MDITTPSIKYMVDLIFKNIRSAYLKDWKSNRKYKRTKGGKFK
jgi:hypothetical protein